MAAETGRARVAASGGLRSGGGWRFLHAHLQKERAKSRSLPTDCVGTPFSRSAKRVAGFGMTHCPFARSGGKWGKQPERFAHRGHGERRGGHGGCGVEIRHWGRGGDGRQKSYDWGRGPGRETLRSLGAGFDPAPTMLIRRGGRREFRWGRGGWCSRGGIRRSG